MNGNEIVWSCDKHSNETVTIRKYVTKYENIQKLMVEFSRKFENCGIKIARLDSILITKSINIQLFTSISNGVRGPLWCWHLLTANAESILYIHIRYCNCSEPFQMMIYFYLSLYIQHCIFLHIFKRRLIFLKMSRWYINMTDIVYIDILI